MLCVETWINTYSRVSKFTNIGDNILAFSSDGEFAAFAKGSSLYILEIKTDTIHQTLSLTNDTMTAISFDSSGKYLIVGTQEGRILQYKGAEGLFLSRLHSFEKNKSITALASYKDLLASATKNGTLCIINLSTKKKKILKPTHKAISALLFLDEDRVLAGSADGTLYLYNLHNIQENITIYAPLKRISEIVAIKESDFLLVHSSSSEISLIDIKNKKLLLARYIQTPSPIEKMLYAQESLFIALSDSRIIKVAILSTEELYEAMLHNQLHRAYKLIEHNPLLITTTLYKQLLERYKIAYKTALSELQNDHIEEARLLLKPYTQISQTKEQARNCLKAFENYPRFCELELQKSYSLAYTMSASYPLLQETLPYKKMEQSWREALLGAQKVLLSSKRSEAKELLDPFATVRSKREIIKLILHKNDLFVSFLKVAQKNDLHTALEIAQRHQMLQELPSYKTLLAQVDKNIEKIQKYIHKGDLLEAQTLLKELDGLKDFQKSFDRLQADLLAMQALHGAYEENDISMCYEILDANPSLSTTQLAHLLERHWSKTIQICEYHALEANVKGIKERLQELLTLPSRREKIGDLLRLSFQRKITLFLEDKMYHNAQNIIYSYIDIFGDDCEILELMERFERLSFKKLAITYDQGKRKQRESWICSVLVD